MTIGNDYLAGVLYEKEMLEAHVRGDVGGIFLNTFKKKNKKGKFVNARKTVRHMIESDLFSQIVVHLAPFDNSHQYSPVPKYIDKLLDDAAWIDGIAAAHPNTEVFLSPFCENKHSKKTLELVFNTMRIAAPHCFFVNSIITGGQEVPGTATEIHIESSKRLPKAPRNEYFVSFDGFGSKGEGDFPDTDVQTILAKYTSASHIRAWNFRNNGKYGHEDHSSVDNRKNLPTVQYLRGTRNTLLPREGNTWGNTMLYKPFADDHGGDLSKKKDCRAMCILPVDRDSVEVRDTRGRILLMMDKVGDPHTGKPKGNRYYTQYYACEIAEKAQQNTGNSLISINGSSLIDANLRSGLFR